MASLSITQMAYCCLVVLTCFALRGGTGFGAAVAMPLMVLVMPLKVLVPTFTVLGLTVGITILGRARHDVSWKVLLKLVPTTLIGVGIGLYLSSRLDARTLTFGLAVLVTAYGIYSLIKTFRAKTDVSASTKILAPTARLLAGAVGTIFGMMRRSCTRFTSMPSKCRRIPFERRCRRCCFCSASYAASAIWRSANTHMKFISPSRLLFRQRSSAFTSAIGCTPE